MGSFRQTIQGAVYGTEATIKRLYIYDKKAAFAQCHLVNDRIIELGTAEYADPSFSL